MPAVISMQFLLFILPLYSVSVRAENNSTDSLFPSSNKQKALQWRYDIVDPVTLETRAVPIAAPETSHLLLDKIKSVYSGIFGYLQPKSEPLDNPFKFTIHCAVDKSTCEEVGLALERVGKRYSNILKVTEKIGVAVQVRSFCEKTCNPNLMAAAMPSALMELKWDRPGVLNYPQALIRLGKGHPGPFQKHDILMTVNSDQPFWFRDEEEDDDETQVDIKPDQVDFELVASHEIIHGLGVISYFVEGKDVLALRPKDSIDHFHPTVYDDMLLHHDRSLGSMVSLKESTEPEAYNKTMITAAEALKLVRQPKSIHLNTTFGPIHTYTASEYLQGTSLVHFDSDTYRNSSDFLMLPSTEHYKGKTADQMTKLFPSSFDIFGERVVWILEDMGYPTILRTSPDLHKDQQKSLSSKVEYSSIVCLATVFLGLFVLL